LTGFTAAEVPDQGGKCFIVTGANTGIGFEAAKVLAARGGRVLLGCRGEAKANAAIARIRQEVSGADVAFLPLDLSDLASVRRAAELAAREPRIDVLLNNAGVMIPPLTRTTQGFELQFGVNHLGGFALTAMLLPKLAETRGSRVVITGSLAHQRGDLRWDDLNAERSYDRIQRYADSKLANLLHLFELDRRLRAAGSPTKAVGCHPGAAATELMRNTIIARVANPAMRALFNTAAMGAWSALQAAAALDVDPGGYYGPQGIGEMRGASGAARRCRRAQDPDWARRLWDVSIAMTGADPGLGPA
jgi:NAD(P)-dependent dehydrogenase (short-subunit alcohol dehydrogenase family)